MCMLIFKGMHKGVSCRFISRGHTNFDGVKSFGESRLIVRVCVSNETSLHMCVFVCACMFVEGVHGKMTNELMFESVWLIGLNVNV